MNKPSSSITVYSPESPLRHPGRLVSGLFTDLFRSRQLIWMLFVRDLKAKHRQSLLGYLWLALPSFSTAAVWVILRSQRIIQVDTPVPYILFVLIGTTVWVSFIAFLNAPLLGFKAGKPVYIKLNVPAEAFMFSSVLRVAFESVVRFLALIPVFFIMKYTPTWNALLIPVAAFLCFTVATGFGLMMVPLGALYDDIGNAISNLSRILMYTVPVIFPVGRSGWLNRVVEANPLTPGVAFCRDVITTGSLEWGGRALLVGGVMLAFGFVSLLFIRIAKPHLIVRMGM